MMYSKRMIATGLIYFWVHFIIELISFAILNTKFAATQVLFTIMLFDVLAFAPQGLFGLFYEKHKDVPIGYIGMLFLGISLIFCSISNAWWFNIGVVFLGIGNALLHEIGAIDTINNSEGKIFASTLFVGGGSFGLCLGKLYHYFSDTLIWLYPIIVIGLLLIYFANKLRNKEFYNKNYRYPVFDIVKPGVSALFVLICVFVTTTIRGFIGYGIPTSWCDEVWEICILYLFMGSGKIFGGFVCDKWGYRITAAMTTLLAIPFLIIGNDNMIISVIGVFLFSMTMGISFAMGVSALPNSVGLAFGLTTLGLILGSFFMYLYRPSVLVADVLICIISIICFILFSKTLKNKA